MKLFLSVLLHIAGIRVPFAGQKAGAERSSPPRLFLPPVPPEPDRQKPSAGATLFLVYDTNRKKASILSSVLEASSRGSPRKSPPEPPVFPGFRQAGGLPAAPVQYGSFSWKKREKSHENVFWKWRKILPAAGFFSRPLPATCAKYERKVWTIPQFIVTFFCKNAVGFVDPFFLTIS